MMTMAPEDRVLLRQKAELHRQEQLKLQLSDEKTLITNAHDTAKFLGFEVTVRLSLIHIYTYQALLFRQWFISKVVNRKDCQAEQVRCV